MPKTSVFSTGRIIPKRRQNAWFCLIWKASWEMACTELKQWALLKLWGGSSVGGRSNNACIILFGLLNFNLNWFLFSELPTCRAVAVEVKILAKKWPQEHWAPTSCTETLRSCRWCRPGVSDCTLPGHRPRHPTNWWPWWATSVKS